MNINNINNKINNYIKLIAFYKKAQEKSSEFSMQQEDFNTVDFIFFETKENAKAFEQEIWPALDKDLTNAFMKSQKSTSLKISKHAIINNSTITLAQFIIEAKMKDSTGNEIEDKNLLKNANITLNKIYKNLMKTDLINRIKIKNKNTKNLPEEMDKTYPLYERTAD